MLNRVAYWSSSSWEALGTGLSAAAYATARFSDGDLLVGGAFVTANGVAVNRVARWDRSSQSWSGFASGLNGPVRALLVFPNDTFIAAGDFTATTAGLDTPRIALWNGTAWQSLGTGLDGSGYALCAHPAGGFVVGGAFGSAGGTQAAGIARWDGERWLALGTGVSGGAPTRVQALSLHPSGEILVGGQFITAGGQPSAFFARWSASGLPWIVESPEPRTLDVLDTLELKATPPSGYPGLSVRWERNGVPILEGPGGASAGGGVVRGATAVIESPSAGLPSTLVIEGVRASDTGLYTAVFSNACGQAASAAAQVDVVGTCPSDTNGDGGVDADDVILFFARWDAGDAAADFNGDGGVDADDVIDFFARWDVGC